MKLSSQEAFSKLQLEENQNRKTIMPHWATKTGGDGFPEKNAAIQGRSAPNTVL